MIHSLSTGRCLRTPALRWMPAAFVIAIALPIPRWASSQPLPVTTLAYSAKYLCGYNALGPGGAILDFTLPYGCQDYTVVEVHNPHTTPVTFTVKVVQDHPTSEMVVPPYPVTLEANEAWSWSCVDVPGGPFGPTMRRGFVEISSPRQLKVVSVYKELCAWGGLTKSASIAKKSSPFFFFFPLGSHSGTFLVGDNVTAMQDTVRHETMISLVNMSPDPVNCNVSFTNQAGGPVHSYPLLIQPNGFAAVTGADLPNWVPRPFAGAVTVQYVSNLGIALLECEEIIQKYVISGTGSTVMGFSVVEVQPVPVR